MTLRLERQRPPDQKVRQATGGDFDSNGFRGGLVEVLEATTIVMVSTRATTWAKTMGKDMNTKATITRAMTTTKPITLS